MPFPDERLNRPLPWLNYAFASANRSSLLSVSSSFFISSACSSSLDRIFSIAMRWWGRHSPDSE